ncbi:MAG: LPS assembly protein LptD [Gammaproteobacteria bacterium]|nr:LPS assembly protein LptD [Gammaproteobacteria bacterium]
MGKKTLQRQAISILVSLVLSNYALAATPAPITSSIRDQSMSDLLDWIPDPKSKNLCHGYYLSSLINFPAGLNQNQTYIQSKSATYFANKPSVLQDVHVMQPGREMTADQATSLVNTKTWQTNDLYLSGHIHLHEAGILALADTGKVNIKNNTATLNTVTYRMTRNLLANSRLPDSNTTSKKITTPDKTIYHITDLTARGEADKISLDKPGFITLIGADYSTCPPTSSAWKIKGSKVTLDRNSGIGTAINSRLYIENVPVFYFPYFNFPIDLQRKSGFLYPMIGQSKSSGYELSLPYYWNIAPNYDAFITPDIYSDRGVQVNTLFRYLTWRRLGQLYYSFLPGDREFAQFKNSAPINSTFNTQPGFERLENSPTDRAYVELQDQYIIDPNWSSLINFNYVSDDYYFQDFSQDINTLDQNQLLELGNVNYDSRYWHFSGLIQNYQTLHPVNNAAIIPDQYARFPQLDIDADDPHYNALDYSLHGEFVNFRSPLLTQNYQTNFSPMVFGQRYDVRPSVSLPLYNSYAHFIPSIEFDATQYSLTAQGPNQPGSISRGLPIMDVDTGLYYQRPLAFFGNNYYQTFEPRLFYLFVPNKNQDDIPIFDTSETTFTYDSIFQTNRFTGIDRIGDADQLGYGLDSKLINSTTGLDRLDASMGQILYFRDRDVTIPNEIVTENTDTRLSPLVGQLSFQFLEHWYAIGNAAWENAGSYFNNAGAGIQYLLDPQHVVNVGYSYLQNGDPLPGEPVNSDRNNLNQINVSTAWKVTQRWSLYSSINYNISPQ